MTNNPYVSPGGPSGYQPQPINPRSQISGPAISLIVVASICLVVVLIGLVVDIFLLASGTIDQIDDPDISPRVTLMIRMVWSFLLIASNSVVLYAAIEMLQLRRYGLAKAGAILSVIPMLGPCCLLGIPFGIWALVVLAKPEVKNAFR